MITYPTAPTVAPGQKITSSQYNGLAGATNARIQNGPGDCAKRIQFWFQTLWSEVVNPEGGAHEPIQRFQMLYQHIDSDVAAAQWPFFGEPGLPLGANLASPVMAFVHGNPSVSAEWVRLEQTQLWGAGPPLTVRARWDQGKIQRGAYDPTTLAQAWPAGESAQGHYRIVQDEWSPHGRSYGGFLPVPEVIGDCGDSIPGPPTPNKKLFFTPLKAGLPLKEYPGTCSPDTPNGAGNHVAFVGDGPFAFFIVFWDGTVERLDKSDYIEGPYTNGGELRKTDGGHLSRVINWFNLGFTGTAAQKSTKGMTVSKRSFAFEKFMASQYFLTPNIAHTDGEDIIPDYPHFTFPAASDPGDGTGELAAGAASVESKNYTSGFVFGGMIAKAAGLTNTIELQALNAGIVIGSLKLTPEEPERMLWFPDAVSPQPLTFRIVSEAKFTDTNGTIEVDCAEQVAGKPGGYDATLILRLASTTGDVLATVDSRGKDVNFAKGISDDYFANGMILNTRVAGPPAAAQFVNDNPVFDAGREMTRESARVVSPRDFIGYEVVDGKSVLHFVRHPHGLDNDTPADAFAGMADAIASVAPVGGVTNEWVVSMDTKVYKDSDSSVWKPDAFSEYFSNSNRCWFMSHELTPQGYPDMSRHFTYGMQRVMHPEAVSGYNYAKGINGPGGYFTPTEEDAIKHYRSCPIYKAPYEIESAEGYEVGGQQRVKVVFKTRWQHADTAPASIPLDVGAWDEAALLAEVVEWGRTDENALREYLVYSKGSGRDCTRGVIGDTSPKTFLWTEIDLPNGNCFPHFFFTKLIEKVHEDGNDDQNHGVDVPFLAKQLAKIELCIRAMCEGFIDGETSAAYGCQTQSAWMFDFTFPNLCFKAFGGRSFTALPTSLRPDLPEGYGPLPATAPTAEVFNQASLALNELTKVRVMLPISVQCKSRTYEGSASITPDWTAGAVDCPSGSTHRFTWSGQLPGASSLLAEGEWTNCEAIVASSFGSVSCDGAGGWQASSQRTTTSFRAELTDPNAIHALPVELRDMLETNFGVFGFLDENSQAPVKQATDDPSEVQGCCFLHQTPCPGFFNDPSGGAGYYWEDHVVNLPIQCTLVRSGVLDVDPPPAGDFYSGRSAAGAPCGNVAARIKSISIANPAMSAFIEVELS